MKRWIVILIAITTTAWLARVMLTASDMSSFFLLRKEMVLLSGMLAYVLMAWTMVLSIRLPGLDKKLGGLDRVYRLHKWAAIWSGVLVFIHWMLCITPKYMVTLGWIDRPGKPSVLPAGGIEGAMMSFRQTATALGEWTAYGVLGLIVVALIRMVPYHWFRRLHKIFPVLFLIIALHSIVLTPVSWWVTPAGVLIALSTMAGGLASIVSLSGMIGRGRTTHGTVTQIVRRADGFLDVVCHLDSPLCCYRPGHFAVVHFSGSRDPHPFSIVSFNTETCDIRFLIKPLGDDTYRLAENLERGSPVTVEGPYGAFDFSSDTKEQIWIAGGVGVAPFLARLEFLAAITAQGKRSSVSSVHMIYCTRPSDPMIEHLATLCRSACVSLEIFQRSRVGRALSLTDVLGENASARSVSLWFCGPSVLGKSLEKAWNTLLLPSALFHREYFSFR